MKSNAVNRIACVDPFTVANHRYQISSEMRSNDWYMGGKAPIWALCQTRFPCFRPASISPTHAYIEREVSKSKQPVALQPIWLILYTSAILARLNTRARSVSAQRRGRGSDQCLTARCILPHKPQWEYRLLQTYVFLFSLSSSLCSSMRWLVRLWV